MSLGARCASFVLVLSLASAAHAQDKQADVDARALFLKGDTAYAEARYEDALAAFQKSYDLSGRPQLLFNIANALERLGRLPEAIDALEKYLASGKVKDKPVVETRLANLKKRLDDQKRAEERAARDREEAERKQREADAQKKPPPPPPPPHEDDSGGRVVPWALVGGGGVLVATGAVFGVLTLSARSEAKSGCVDSPAGHLCDDSARSALSREKTFGVVADVCVLAGLVAGGAGAYLLLAKPAGGDAGAAAGAGAGVRVRVTTKGIDVVGRF